MVLGKLGRELPKVCNPRKLSKKDEQKTKPGFASRKTGLCQQSEAALLRPFESWLPMRNPLVEFSRRICRGEAG